MRKTLVLLAFLAIPSLAQTVSNLDFGKGPVQWLMTREEQRAWREVRTEEQARDFADLFWVRRDPTPGTPLNEFRQDFESRVQYADARFAEGKRRGSMTDRGRVLVVLGFPSNLGSEGSKKTSQYMMGMGRDNSDPTGGRALAARDVWLWEHKDAAKYGMPKIEIIFFFDGPNGAARRDPQRPDFITALPAAIKDAIKSPELTTVPDWARSGIRFEEAKVAETTEPTALTPPAGDPLPKAGEGTPGPAPAPAVPAAPRPVKAAGAGKLTFVKDAFALQPQSGNDPFAGLVNVSKFSRNSDLGWAAEYCTGKESSELPAVNVGLRISGPAEGERENFTAPAEEMVPDSIKASPGCYLVRGSVPLQEMQPGTYEVTITVGKYNLTREFRIE